ncbi:leucine-rich repeat protein [Microbacterium esteraromaticum]|uniref:leucine-rich repeat protein n=1 Tax=Microbacterium esteraromaticum TaxID=57043 RepID=UPI001CD30207|nr:leucine-rich repeat protein [Microbacterium esteraromaticum]MCA1306781.1 leucine-rich repeat protein [Microbacterium esteraromaticum]
MNMRALRRITVGRALERSAVQRTSLPGGTLFTSTAARMKDLNGLLSTAATVSAGSPALVITTRNEDPAHKSARAERVRSQIDQVLVYGDRAGTADVRQEKAHSIRGPYELRDMIAEYWSRASQPRIVVMGEMGFEVAWAIDHATGSALAVQSRGAKRRTMKVSTRDAVYELVSGYGACVREGVEPRARLVVPASVAGMGTVLVCDEAFAGAPLESVSFVAPMRVIGTRAFADSTALSDVCFSRTIETIGEEAFAGCTSIQELALPQGIRAIEGRAFADCTSLLSVELPESLQFIADDAFAGCVSETQFRVIEGSEAHAWVVQKQYAHLAVPAASEPMGSPPAAHMIQRDGVEYAVMSDQAVEVSRIHDRNGQSRRTIPAEIDGFTVTGLGYEAVGRDTTFMELALPDTLRWIAPHAIAPGAGVERVSGASGLQARGRKALPDSATLRVSKDLDAGVTRLSLRIVCRLLEVDLPAEHESIADDVFTGLAAGMLSSAKGNLFFGSFNGEDSVEKVDRLMQRGVRMFVTDRELRTSDGQVVPQMIHPHPRRAFTALCAWIAGQHAAKTIAVTGSVGKTSTKEMIQLVCRTAFQTLYSTGNQNGIAQVGRYIQKVTTNTEVYIQETGAARPGAVEQAARMLAPDAFVITNIGVNHIGNYGGSQDAILRDKSSHDHYLPDDGVAFLNFDDPKLKALELTHRIISYAIDDASADYYAEQISERDGRLQFLIVDAASGERHLATVNSFGRHNVGNAVVAFAIGRWLGIPVAQILEGIQQYKGEGLRQNLVEVGGRRALIDCYNASEIAIASTADALQSISVPDGGRRVFVIADIDDKLGDITEEVHRRVGRRLIESRDIDLFVLFGEHAAWAAEELREGGRDVFHTTDRSELHSYLRSELRDEDLPAFKGGQQMALSITIDELYGTSFVLADGDVLLRRGTDHVADGLRFREISEFGVELRGSSDPELGTVVVPSEVAGEPVLLLGKGAFSQSKVHTLTLQAPLRTIAPSAFFHARELEHIELPESLRVIGRSAFNGCDSLTEIDIPEGVTTIEDRAFYRCTSLTRVRIPASVRTIGEQVFSYSTSVVIECPPGSFAEEFCRANWPRRAIRSI